MPGTAAVGPRAARILDAASELSLRLGYRKVTIGDIAQRADIGKGTVYLHWRTKEALFEALVRRDVAEMVEELRDAIRIEAAEVLPHRLLRRQFLSQQRKPLLRALVAGDSRLLGMPGEDLVRGPGRLASWRYYRTMLGHGLLRDDIPDLEYTLNATLIGFHLVHGDPDIPEPDAQRKADALGYLVRAAFESAEPPSAGSLAVAVDEITVLLDELVPPESE